MKRFGKLSALLLVAVMLLGLCACSSPEKELAGTWKCEMDMTEIANEAMAAELGDEFASNTSLKIPVTATFTEDKTYTLSVDLDAAEEAMLDWLSTLSEPVTEYLYQMSEAEGMTREDVDAIILQTYGVSVSDMVESMLDEMAADFSIEDVLGDDSEESGVFKAEDGKLYMAETEEDLNDNDYFTYTVSGSTLTLESAEGDEASELFASSDYDMESLFPLVFKKQ